MNNIINLIIIYYKYNYFILLITKKQIYESKFKKIWKIRAILNNEKEEDKGLIKEKPEEQNKPPKLETNKEDKDSIKKKNFKERKSKSRSHNGC